MIIVDDHAEVDVILRLMLMLMCVRRMHDNVEDDVYDAMVVMMMRIDKDNSKPTIFVRRGGFLSMKIS